MELLMALPILMAFYLTYRLGRIEGGVDMRDKFTDIHNELLDQLSNKQKEINKLSREINRWRNNQ